MSVVFLVLPLALLVVFVAIAAYAWAARRGQFDDLTTPAMRILHEDGDAGPPQGAREPGAESPSAEPPGERGKGGLPPPGGGSHPSGG
jgi:cbb3-type cytochrome oxidase maturation protein